MQFETHRERALVVKPRHKEVGARNHRLPDHSWKTEMIMLVKSRKCFENLFCMGIVTGTLYALSHLILMATLWGWVLSPFYRRN